MSMSLVEDYLTSLPAGLDSYPEACIKGAVVCSLAEGLGERLLRGQVLHPVAQRMIDDPPMANSWVPDVQLHVLYLAAMEVCFSGSTGASAFEEWIYLHTRQSLQSPLYRILFVVLSPGQVLRGLPRRWAAFHRGTTLDVVTVEKARAKLRFSCPPGLMPEAALIALRAVLRAAGAAAGAKLVAVELAESAPGCSVLDVRWM